MSSARRPRGGVVDDRADQVRLAGRDRAEAHPVAGDVGHLRAVRSDEPVHRATLAVGPLVGDRPMTKIDLVRALEAVQRVLVVVGRRRESAGELDRPRKRPRKRCRAAALDEVVRAHERRPALEHLRQVERIVGIQAQTR